MSILRGLVWTWYPSVVTGVVIWTAAYLAAVGPLRSRFPGAGTASRKQQLAFHAGTLVLLIALCSPLDELADDLHLFSAHMLQHLLLMFITPPLWLIGTPGWLVEGLVPRRGRSVLRALTHPLTGFAFFAGVMFFWHIPAIYQWAEAHEGIHIFEHLSFIGGALIGWWPVLGPETWSLYRTSPPVRILYTFLLAFPCTALAAILTFAAAPLYPAHLHGAPLFGLNPLDDQRLGGLMMWFPTHMVILLALGTAFFRWLREDQQATGDVAGSDELIRSDTYGQQA
jgi:putative membrane protein